jgi:MarC family integral membrane protein
LHAESITTCDRLTELQLFAAKAVGEHLNSPIARVLRKTGINVMTRLMGLILAALAVEVMTDGLHKLFPVLARFAPALAALRRF